MSSVSDSQQRFFDLLDQYPRFTDLWNLEKREYDPNATTATMYTCSPGEGVILKCLLTIWRGNAGPDGAFKIDLAELAIVDPVNRRPLLEWLADPFWP